MFNFQYHIPSAMPDNRWNWIQHDTPSYGGAAEKCIVTHFRGSEYPAEVEVWIRRSTKQRPHKIRKFLGRENGKAVYSVKPLKVGETVQ